MTRDELITRVEQEIMDWADEVDSTDYSNAVDNAEKVLGWTLPVSSNFQVYWIKEVAIIQLLSIVRVGMSASFDVENIRLKQRFDNLSTLLKEKKKDFEKAQEESPFEFAGVSSYQMFGTKIDAGFQYEERTGVETTYTDDNSIILNPQADS